MAKKSYKVLKTIIAIILLTTTMLGLVSIKNNSNAVNYNKTLAYSGTQLLGNSMLYNNYGYNYVPYRGLALQGSQVYAAMANSYKNAIENGIYHIYTLLNDPNLYCMNHGYTFAGDKDYLCYETGYIDSKLAYIIARQEDNYRHQNEDLEANAVWYYFSDIEKSYGQIPLYNNSDFKNLWKRGDKAVEVMKNHANGISNIKVEGPADNPVNANAEGKYGPFKITYPNVDGILVGESIKLIINEGTENEFVIDKAEEIIASGEEFYLTVEDHEIKLGEVNKLKVIYTGYTYSGTYAKLTPYREMVIQRQCYGCKNYFGFKTMGYWKDNKNELTEAFVPDGSEEYVYTVKNGSNIYVEEHKNWLDKMGYGCPICEERKYIGLTARASNVDDIYQNLIYIEPNEETFEEPKEIEFVPGKLITLEGKVWLDGQTGLKEVKEPNNEYNVGESPIENIEVILKKDGEDKPVQTTKTDGNGNYKFEDVLADGKTKYYIEFRYDGINYEAVTANEGSDETIDSDATEVGRTDFNDRFQTITKNTATGADGKTTELTYTYEAGASGEFDKATLETTNEDGVKEEFAMIARTEPVAYEEDTENIDLGLVKRGVDLSATTQIESAIVQINGVTKTYPYNVITGDDFNKTINIEEKDATYNLYLYKSDYNYRIKDYTGLSQYTADNTSNGKIGQFFEEYKNLDELAEDGLEVALVYQIFINNESAAGATVNEIAYYYKSDFVKAVKVLNDEGKTIDGIEFTSDLYDGNSRINIPVNINLTDSNNQKTLYIAFLMKVNPNEEGNINKDVKNWVEITSYSTDGGYIDIDSAPDNIGEKHEDDTDDAGIVYIKNNTSERTISGYVFEDKKEGTANSVGNGFYEAGENKVNDVIVQLIEVKDIVIGSTTKRLEYIWQETTSGSDTVKYITTDGTSIGKYEVEKKDGGYEFKGFIPGNYIVRFIYGDGTYYETDIKGNSTEETVKDNIERYNGQDYKSAIDSHYQDKEHNESSYADNSSMARDNEMRRIEEMAYVATVTNIEDLKINNKDKLANTWMCAETSDIKINVDDTNADNTTKVVNKTINFGLVERPEASLELEKHIIGLDIEGIGKTTINNGNINAAKNNNYTINDNNIKGFLSLITVTNKGKTGTNKNSIGTWKVETELDKVQDKIIRITYSYTVKLSGELNYIGKELKDKDLKDNGVINDIKTNINSAEYEIGKYLGQAYYTGVVNNTIDTLDSVKKIKIEDYLSGLDLESGDFEGKGSKEKNVLIKINPDDKKTENVQVIQSNNEEWEVFSGQASEKELTVSKKIDTSGGKDLEYRSYVAQLVGTENTFTTKAGLTLNSTLGNLAYVQSYSPYTKTTDIAKENDEFVAETVIITANTGGTVADSNKEQKLNLVIAVVAGLAVVATGIVLVKKFVIK